MSEETRDFTPKAIGKIIQLDYDLITSLDGACMYCLTDAQVQMILGITDYYGWATRWFSSSGDVDKQTILDLQGGLVAALMNGCCDDNSILSQWTPEGHYQQSTDGGTTYTDTPGADPRNPQPAFPPFLPPGTMDDDCTYADSVVQFIKTRVVEIISDTSTADEAISVITGAVTTILIALSTTIIGAIIIALLGAAALLIAIAGGAAFKAAFTSDVWDRLRCNIKIHIGAAGSFTQANIDAIYTQIGTDESGITALFLKQMIAMMGTIGVTNASRSGLGAIDATCCPSCDMGAWTVGLGTEISRDSSSITVQCDVTGTSMAAIITTGDKTKCCVLVSGVGAGWNIQGIPCGEDISGPNIAAAAYGDCLSWIDFSRVVAPGTPGDIVVFGLGAC